MKKLFVIAAMLTVSFGVVSAQAVVADGFDRLQVTYKTPTPEVQHELQNALLTLPGYTSGGEIGSPVLPVRSDIIEVPFCDNIVVTVENAVYDTIQLSQYNIFHPLQPSRSKSDTTRHDLVFNDKVYETDAFYSLPLAKVEVMGVARDRRLAQLTYSPVQVNPVTGQVVVCRSADVTVTYVGADVDRTLEHYQRYHTPAFSVGTTLNSLYSSNQAIKQSSNQPVRMVIAVPNVLRCKAIERFANWKRRQGLMVDLLYYQDMSIANSTALATYLQSLYDDATDEAPAPTYLLLVGDHNQLQAFGSKLPNAGYWSNEPDNDHITDLYFTTWTSGDYLPDCYQGRFSATDTATLAAIVNKTLYYEQYAFSSDIYLANAVLVSGEDDATHGNYDYAWRYADPTMDYIAYNYVNAANGYAQVTYYKNDTNYAPTGVTVNGYCSANSASSELRNLYNTGIGLINYSAHGDWDGWHKPSFKVSNANSMTNNGMPSFMIGNCCLSSKFDKATCFAEALLRKGNNAGAVAYIGGTNSTYWTQDVYWSVGVRNSINHTMAPTYVSNKLGVYDRIFHTHSEAFNQHAATAGAIVYYGNFSVNSSSSSDSFKRYYWEIYELMGDPSLMPWMGRAANNYVNVSRSGQTMTITTAPHSYVALVDTSLTNLVFAAHADGNGQVTFDLSENFDLNATLLSVTVQNRKPYFRYFASDPVGIDEVEGASISVYPNPATDHVTVDGLPDGSTVSLYDAQGRLVTTQSLGHSATQSLDVSALASGLYLLRIQTPSAVTVRKLVINK